MSNARLLTDLGEVEQDLVFGDKGSKDLTEYLKGGSCMHAGVGGLRIQGLGALRTTPRTSRVGHGLIGQQGLACKRGEGEGLRGPHCLPQGRGLGQGPAYVGGAAYMRGGAAYVRGGRHTWGGGGIQIGRAHV